MAKAVASKIQPKTQAPLPQADSFAARHIGPSEDEIGEMLKLLGQRSLDSLTDAAVPPGIRAARPLKLWTALSEAEAARRLRSMAEENRVWRSYIGMGYHGAITPPVIQRSVLENPGWYTAYTPYQAEIAQGRLEALLNFQTMITDLTGLPVANASLLDEATAAAEAMAMSWAAAGHPADKAYFVSAGCHPQIIAVVGTRAEALGVRIARGEIEPASLGGLFGLLLQYPATDGEARDYAPLCARAKAAGALVTLAADPLALALLKTPGEMGADLAVGSTQRFGVPMGYGGPHAAYLACRDEFKRLMPGRVVGVSKDSGGRPALRLALQTREQHIRREKATSNICTAQVLPAVMAGFYAVYHGPEGLRRIARRIHGLAMGLRETLAAFAAASGFEVSPAPAFDTVRVRVGAPAARRMLTVARTARINLRSLDEATVAVAFDETTTEADVRDLLRVFSGGTAVPEPDFNGELRLPEALRRRSEFLTHPVFNSHHSETEMLRYIRGLEARDLSLTTSMIPLGSCTMKLNAASEMAPLSWPEFAQLHPFAPADQAGGYAELFRDLSAWICEMTGFAAVSLQPNAGSQGEFAGLLVIRRYHESRGEGKRKICLIPRSAHGTNPASAAMVGFTIVPVECLPDGDIDRKDLRAKADAHAADLAALMVTYPSTHGVFEEGIREICELVHAHGGLVYMDGANMNAQVGLCRPADFGADVCHLNLHKTFCIPHGGGGPGMGPIAVTKDLAPFLPGHPLAAMGGPKAVGAIAAAPWSSASILVIPWAYVAQMGAEGLKRATQVAILNANYVAKRLEGHYPVLFKGRSGLVAHECLIDVRPLKDRTGVTVDDVAKRLMDYGFHAPTVSFPIAGTLMIEPTESESMAELDRFCQAMVLIREEIREIAAGRADREDNVLKNAPHTVEAVCANRWERPYSREKAAFPAPWIRERKFWPAVGRIDGVFGDRNFLCTCSAYQP